jgi:integrase
MANHYTNVFLRKENRKSCPYRGVLKYAVPNPDYVEDTRSENQRRRGRGKFVNPDYVEDTREPNQRYPYVMKQITRVFDDEATRAILNDPTRKAPTTKSDAMTVLTAWHKQMEAEYAAPDGALTVWEYVTHYIDNRERMRWTDEKGRTHGVQDSTLKDYRGTMRYLKDGKAIDGIPLRELTPRDVEQWESSLLASGLSGTTALKAHRLLKQVCKHAVEVDDLPKTPVRGFKAPSRSTGKPNALDAEGRRRAMLGIDAMEPSPTKLAAELALYTGMRRGEICALTWGCVDLEGIAWEGTDERGPKLRVVQAFGVRKGGAFLKAPKTVKGRRVIPLSGTIIATLQAQRAAMWDEWSAAMRKAKLKPTVAAFNTLYVVGDAKGNPCGLDTLTHNWAQAAREMGLTGTRDRLCTLHDLRHSYATNAISRGVDVASVAAVLGHEQTSTTLDMYTDEDSAAKRRAMQVVASDLDAARTGNVLPFHPRRTGTES